MDWLTPTIAGGAALGSAAIGAAGTAVRNKKTLKYTKQLMDYQWQNYGSPQAQMAAYKAAGVNPFASNMQQAQQPQMEQPNIESPGLQGLQSFIGMVQNMSNLITQSYNNDLVSGQKEGQTLANKLAAFDLTNIKPEEMKQLQANIDKIDEEAKLTKKQRFLVSKQILSEVAKAKNIDQETLMKQLDYAWKNRQFDKGMPDLEYFLMESQRNKIDQDISVSKQKTPLELDILKNQKSLQDLDISRNQFENTVQQSNPKTKLEVEFGKSVQQLLDSDTIDKMLSKFGVPKEFYPLVKPLYYGIMLMMINGMGSAQDMLQGLIKM